MTPACKEITNNTIIRVVMPLRIKFILVFLLILIPLFCLSSSVLADWTFDLTPPLCTLSWSLGSGMMVGRTVDVYARASDAGKGDSTIDPNLMTLIVSPTPTPVLLSTTSTPATFSVTKIYEWHPVPIVPTTYTFSLTAYDSALNRCSVVNNFLVNINPPAWMQVSGDVHTNR